jgi:hypothetical protein
MTPSIGDRLAMIGRTLSTLAEDIDNDDTTFRLADVFEVDSGSRICIDCEVMTVTGIDDEADTITVTRAVDSLAVQHYTGASVRVVDSMFALQTATRGAGFLAPLRASTRFVLLPVALVAASEDVTAQAQPGIECCGTYQEGAGAQVQIDRPAMTITARLGLVILTRPEGGHWELDVTEV